MKNSMKKIIPEKFMIQNETKKTTFFFFIPREERDSRFIASKLAVITVMRSWPGLYQHKIDIKEEVVEMIGKKRLANLPNCTVLFLGKLMHMMIFFVWTICNFILIYGNKNRLKNKTRHKV